MTTKYLRYEAPAPLAKNDARSGEAPCADLSDVPPHFVCTRPRGHDGRHEASGGAGWLYASWDAEPVTIGAQARARHDDPSTSKEAADLFTRRDRTHVYRRILTILADCARPMSPTEVRDIYFDRFDDTPLSSYDDVRRQVGLLWEWCVRHEQPWVDKSADKTVLYGGRRHVSYTITPEGMTASRTLA